MNSIKVAHSPDADDIFMYYAIKFGWVDVGLLPFENIADDIESLNKATLKGKYDICAISFALYPFVKKDYALLKTAVSFGEGYGPKLIKQKRKILKENFTVALSGEYTTNAMLFRIKYPNAKITYMNFLDIQNAVLYGKVDAGVLIHESILSYDDSLEVECEIWDIWQELSGKYLPLPLGGMCIRRSLPINKAIDYERYLIKAVDVANKNKKLLSQMLTQRELIRVDDKTLDKYLKLYANDSSVQLSEIQIEAIDKLFTIGYEYGFYKDITKTDQHIIPTEYEKLRGK
ncbi:MAG: succinate--CoA ligase [Campylobacteraceae bacterium 4484_166]|nr:MAG: succinate--CoA ligase [Campylobacteraceae bacterium 4484_166]